MKALIALTALAFGFSLPAIRPAGINPIINSTHMETSATDSAAIAQLLDTYFKSIYTGDVALLRSTFHPGTLLFGDVKGQPYAKTLEQYLDGVANRQSPKDSGKPYKGEVVSVSAVNSIATARVRVRMYDFDYTDFLSLHKIDGHWLIVSKLMTDVSGSNH